jgi:hypothetical protein
MTTSSFEYFVLRLTPDPLRGESLNVGVVAFLEEGARVLIRPDTRRIKAFNPDLLGLNWDTVEADIQNQLNDLAVRNLQEFFIKTALAPFTIDSKPGFASISNESSADDTINAIIQRFVDTPTRSVSPFKVTSKKTASPLNSDLRRWFRGAKVFSSNVSDIVKHRVVPNYPVDIELSLFAEFALQNGALHIMETLDLRGVSKLSKTHFGEAAMKSVILDQAKQLDNPGKRIAVIAADDYGAVKSAIHMVSEYSNDVIAYASDTDRQRLADFVAGALHLDNSLPAMH